MHWGNSGDPDYIQLVRMGLGLATAAGAVAGLQHDGSQLPEANNVGEGFSFTVPASPVARTLTVYVTANYGVGMLTATLSDDSGAPYTQIVDGSNDENAPGIFTITYSAPTVGQTLNVTYTLISENEPHFNSANGPSTPFRSARPRGSPRAAAVSHRTTITSRGT